MVVAVGHGWICCRNAMSSSVSAKKAFPFQAMVVAFMKDLTTSVYNFEDLIRGNFLYVDKTEYIWQLIRPAKGMYFLSRPRRFGKSLLVSTLKAIFEGKKELFKGLAIYGKPYDWKPYPVIHLDMAGCDVHTEDDLRDYLVRMMTGYGKTT